MPELRLPEPGNWAQTGKVALPAKIALAVAFCYVVVRGLIAVYEGSYLTAAVWWATLGTPFLLVAAYLSVAVGGAKQRVSSDSSGLTFRPDKRLSVAYFVVMAVLVPAAALFAVLLSRGELDLSTTRGIQIAVSVAFCALALLAVMALAAGIRRGGAGYLKFTPTRIEIADVRVGHDHHGQRQVERRRQTEAGGDGQFGDYRARGKNREPVFGGIWGSKSTMVNIRALNESAECSKGLRQEPWPFRKEMRLLP